MGQRFLANGRVIAFQGGLQRILETFLLSAWQSLTMTELAIVLALKVCFAYPTMPLSVNVASSGVLFWERTVMLVSSSFQ